MKFKELKIDGAYLITPNIYADDRGSLNVQYSHYEFKENGIRDIFTADNTTRSKKDVLRGLHFQIEPFAQSKLVRCVKGRIYDVIVDIRRNSKTYGKWKGVELSEENGLQLYIPVGFAHGFLSLTDSEVNYKTSNLYFLGAESGLRWNDPKLKIKWGIKNPILSEKDKRWPLLKNKS